VGEIMTEDPVTIKMTASVRDAVRVLRSMEIRHLPVIGEHGELVGIVTDRDVRDVMVPYWIVEDLDINESTLDEPVSKVMTREPVTIQADTTIDEVIEILVRMKVGALPVVEPRSRDLIGIVSYIDILREVAARS
jgi:acetoin utilization protein AcuB